MSNIECTACNKEFDSQEALTMHNQAKHAQEVKTPMFSSWRKKNIKNWMYILIFLGIIISVVYFSSSTIKTLPPTDIKGHIEDWPPTQVQKSPIPIAIFKHILEHTKTPSRRPGAIISYNCEDYQCESSLIEKLEAFTKEYSHVYVAPYPNMDAKITLTKFNQQKVLEEYNKEIIEEFIQ